MIEVLESKPKVVMTFNSFDFSQKTINKKAKHKSVKTLSTHDLLKNAGFHVSKNPRLLDDTDHTLVSVFDHNENILDVDYLYIIANKYNMTIAAVRKELTPSKQKSKKMKNKNTLFFERVEMSFTERGFDDLAFRGL
jgi:hypothetical protein